MSTDLSRRAIVAGAASVPALALPAVALTSTIPDPIFAAINRWKEALAIEEAAFEAHENAEVAFKDHCGCRYPTGLPEGADKLFEDSGIEHPWNYFRTHEQITGLKGDLAEFKPLFHRTLNHKTADYEASVLPLEEAQEDASHVRISAALAVFDIVPTTLAGMRAKIDFAMSVDHVTGLLVDNEEALQNFLDTLYEAARLMAVQS